MRGGEHVRGVVCVYERRLRPIGHYGSMFCPCWRQRYSPLQAGPHGHVFRAMTPASSSSRTRSVRSWPSIATNATGPIRATARRSCDSTRSMRSSRAAGPGPHLFRGEPDRSLLILAVRHEGDVSMPPKKKLAQNRDRRARRVDQDGRSVAWNGRQSDYPRSTAAGQPRWDDRARNFWAFQAASRRSSAEVVDSRWPRSPIDRFILAKLEAKGLQPAAPAEKRTLLRRVTLDLLGLPPIARGNRRVPRRRRSARVRARRRPAARVSAIRRALGPALARRRPLRRQQRHGRQPRLFRRLALSRLRDRARSTPTSRSTASSKSSSPATCSPSRSRRGGMS